MKKKLLFTLLIILFGSICVYAGTVINAYEVKFTSNKTSVTNADDALNELYSIEEENEIDLLWSNSNPSASFSAATISLDLSNYETIIVTGIFHKSYADGSGKAHHYGLVVLHKGDSGEYNLGSGSTYSAYRTITVKDTGVIFSTATYGNSSNTTNEYAIPVNIYGIKKNITLEYK